ncbi:MAG TPA: Uma2 family endonuclease [Pyrinomonadaceae bacterium]|nr:Uma2 family endonuclease [Pyrinomonadaceae bacterium]
MNTQLKRLTIADWDAMPYGDGNRYEIIEGELFVSRSPGLTHQMVSDNLLFLIRSFLKLNPIGVVVTTPGLILSNFSGVIPDLVFFLNEQRDGIITDDRLMGPPDLVVEIVSPGTANNRRDRVVKLQLYAKHGVSEYWIVDPKKLTVEKYVNQGASLILVETLEHGDELSTSALPGFSCPLTEVFETY